MISTKRFNNKKPKEKLKTLNEDIKQSLDRNRFKLKLEII